jgi:hypothetical protein
MSTYAGIPVSEGPLLVDSAEKFSAKSVHPTESKLAHATSQLDIDGVDTLDIAVFVGQDHYDCERFANGGFGSIREQLDCAPVGTGKG